MLKRNILFLMFFTFVGFAQGTARDARSLRQVVEQLGIDPEKACQVLAGLDNDACQYYLQDLKKRKYFLALIGICAQHKQSELKK